MKELNKFCIAIHKLSNATHQYAFEFDAALFSQIDYSIVDKGKGNVYVELRKNESLINMSIRIEGDVELVCDRSLDTFDFPVKTEKNMIFKYGEEEAEPDDNMVIITGNTQQIDLTQYIYEFVGLEIPMKKLHPRFENDNPEDEIVYSDADNADMIDGEDRIDPRWQQLKNIQNN